MRKYRFFSNQPLASGQEVILDHDLAHHIARVLRLGVGEVIYLFNNSGNEFCTQITLVTKNTVTVLITSVEVATTESPLDLHLGLGLIKFDKIDLILQKCCELGVKKVSLIATQHTSIKHAYQRAHEKSGHWQKVLESAAGQCWRSTVPSLEIVEKIEHFINSPDPATVSLILDPRAPKNTLLNEPQPYQKIRVLIGPEGGFSEQECALATAQGFLALNLGPRILRTETACFCALTILQAKYGDLLC